jgi:hypothetical protein
MTTFRLHVADFARHLWTQASELAGHAVLLENEPGEPEFVLREVGRSQGDR